jgi:predicted anti-sigma-YlaC factor YlaD
MGNLSCERFTELVGDHVEGVLPSGERAAVEAHLRSCPRCRDLLDGYARVAGVVQRATDVRMPLGARARLRRLLSHLWHRS